MELLGAAYQFPDYYGRNLDAADEILSDMREDSSSDKLSLRPLFEALLAEAPAVERARIWKLLRDHFVVE